MSNANGVGSPAYIKGVPHPLPSGESVLWQGAPNLRAVATHVFHWRLFAAYFAVMLAWWALATSAQVGSTQYLSQGAIVLAMSTLVLGVAWGLSVLVANSTWYAITTHRLVLRIGMVFPMSINVPFSAVESAGVGQFKDGTGQVVLRLTKAQRIAYIALWPHCSVLRWAQPEPVLRGLTDAAHVGRILAQAVSEAADGDTRVQRGGGVRESTHESLTLSQPAGIGAGA
jgi:hypothetical protein